MVSMFELVMSFLNVASNSAAENTTASTGGAIAALVAALFGAFWIFYCFAFLVGLVFFVIWLWMLIDCLSRNDYEGPNDKLLWALVILFAGIIGAAIYYFMVKRKKEKQKLPEKEEALKEGIEE